MQTIHSQTVLARKLWFTMKFLFYSLCLGNCFQSQASVISNGVKGSKSFTAFSPPSIAASPPQLLDAVSSVSEGRSSDSSCEEIVYPRPRRIGDGSNSDEESYLQPITESLNFAAESKLISTRTFQSLLECTSKLESADSMFVEIMQFISQSIESHNCSLSILCERYPLRFRCDEQDHLTQILFGYFKLSGHFQLSKIPNSVKRLTLSRNQLGSIGNFNDLKGSSLQCLHLIRNSKLNLNLSALEMRKDSLPLEVVSVSPRQVAEYLEMRGMNAKQWIKISLLKELKIVTGSKELRRFSVS